MSKSGRESFPLNADCDAPEKREENSAFTFGVSRLWTSFESSLVSVKILKYKMSEQYWAAIFSGLRFFSPIQVS